MDADQQPSSFSDQQHVTFPDKPERPEESDCCGSGCVPCVFDVYEERLKKWERTCREIRDNPGVRREEEGERYLSDVRYKPFRVESVSPHTHDTRVFTFRAEGGGELGLAPGQHVIMRGEGGASRAYTPIALRPGAFDVLVRLYALGRMSEFFASLSPGDVVHLRGPYGGRPYRPRAHGRVLMLCAGTGIAPAYAIATAIVADDTDETFVRLLFCVRSIPDILLRDELRALADNWNFTVRIHVSGGVRPGAGPRYGEDVVYAKLDRGALAPELGGTAERPLVLICGTEGFNADMREHALALGVDASDIHVFK